VSSDRLVDIVMPQMGISVAEATLLAWRAQPGERVEMDAPICDISSDKVDSEVPSPAAGRLVELLVAEGETVDVGTPIARFELEAEPAPAAAQTAVSDATPAAPPPESRGASRQSPVVTRLAEELGVDLDTLTGTGAGGRIRKEDVLAVAGGPATAGLYQAPAAETLSPIRRSIAEHMVRSLRTAATVTSWIEVDFEAVEARRRELGVTALPLVAAATVATLVQFGELNAWLVDERITRHRDVNLGVAVSLGDDGLIVPVIRAAQTLGVVELAERIADVAKRAHERALSVDEVGDGTFTITNPGQFGTVMATAVISQPQVAILDVEAIVRRPVVVSGADGEQVAIHSMCVLGLSWDHRATDGAYAARFLAALRDRLQAV
jgi:2-oxoglutarate dehydrogenase E2 component (dihydrolipoamide succinyltransferase)